MRLRDGNRPHGSGNFLKKDQVTKPRSSRRLEHSISIGRPDVGGAPKSLHRGQQLPTPDDQKNPFLRRSEESRKLNVAPALKNVLFRKPHVHENLPHARDEPSHLFPARDRASTTPVPAPRAGGLLAAGFPKVFDCGPDPAIEVDHLARVSAVEQWIRIFPKRLDDSLCSLSLANWKYVGLISRPML